MGHHCHHHHSHAPAKSTDYNRAFAIAASLNLTFVITQIIAALYAHSMGLLADAFHNLGDVAGLFLAWLANWLAQKESKQKFSYGYKRTTILASLANALLLIGSCAIIGYESVLKLLNPITVNESVVIITAIIGTMINGGTALLFMKGRKDDLNIKGAFAHLAGDAVLSIGVAIAGIIILFTQWTWLDPLVGLILTITIVVGTWSLLRDSINLLLDAVPHNVDLEAVRTYLLNLSGVKAIHDIHIWGLSTTDNALTAHLVMPDNSLNDSDYQYIKHELLEKFNIGHVTLQVEKGHAEDACGQTLKC